MNPWSKIAILGVAAGSLIVVAASPCFCGVPDEPDTSGVWLAVNQEAKPFALQTVDGKEVKLSDFSGQKAVLLMFISIHCFECDEAVRIVPPVVDEHGQSGELQVLFVVVGDEKIARRIAKSGKCDSRVPLLVEQAGSTATTTADAYGVVATPTLVLIGRDGKIRWGWTGRVSFAALDEAIHEVLAFGP